jgi:type IV pilus assembly protein PilA
MVSAVCCIGSLRADIVGDRLLRKKMPPVRPRSDRRQTAFTLIELMVVVVIIGILIGLVITVIPKVRKAAYGASTQAQLATLTNAIQQYYGDYKAYPGPLANDQLGTGTYPPGGTGPQPYAVSSTFGLTGSSPFPAGSTANVTTLNYSHISGAQNLVLGLLGGLELQYSGGVLNGFIYNPQDIFSDGFSPAPRGPASLNASTPRRQQAYIQVKSGDISVPSSAYNSTGASFADAAGRSPTDAMIPVFLDKYADPLPILYLRTNPGAQAIAGFGTFASTTAPDGPMYDDSAPLVDSTTNVAVTAQYDLRQVLDYTKSIIGTVGNTPTMPTANPNSIHGLQGDGNSNLTDPIMAGTTGAPYNNGKNALAYLKDPNFAITTGMTNTHSGVARQKDGYLLISAGPDRLYGTADDVINPGPLLPAQ